MKIPVCAVQSSDSLTGFVRLRFRSHCIGLLTEKAVMICVNSIRENYCEACEFGYRILSSHQKCMKVATLSIIHS